MSSLEQRLAVFRQLPLRAQLATITSSKANQVLSHRFLRRKTTEPAVTVGQKQDYIASLEQIHAESLAAATELERLVYRQAKELLDS